jgi:hypothetical protein
MVATLRYCKAISLITIGVCVFVTGCKPKAIWSAESRSGDGTIVASAHAIGANGFGNGGGLHTLVYVKWVADSQPPTLILDLVDATDSPADTHVEMKWLSPTHLELTWAGNQTIGFQAVKWAGVDISVRALTSNTDTSQK